MPPFAGSRSISPTRVSESRLRIRSSPTKEETNSEFGLERMFSGVSYWARTAALLEDGDLVTHLYGLVNVVGDEDDGLLYVLLDAQELVLKPLARDRVDSPEGLVHEHDRGVRRHRPRYPDALLLTARELRGITVAVVVRGEADESRSSSTRSPMRCLSQPSRLGTVAMFVAMVRWGKRPICWMA